MKTTTLLLAALLLCAPAPAQAPDPDSPALLFESPAGLRLALGDNPHLWRQHDRRDTNGDGIAELPLVIVDEAGNPEAFRVMNHGPYGANNILLSIPWNDLLDLLGGQEPTRFLGFYPSFFGSDSGLADITVTLGFRTEGGVAFIGLPGGGQKQTGATMRSFRVPADQSFIADLNEDGVPELIVRNRETRTVQVWGRNATSTATEEEIEAALFHLFQNYPNPFRERTTITYEVEQPGPVTITIYDLLGHRVRTLVDANQPVGAYRVEWDGRDAQEQPVASGAYFYRLRVGDAVSSKQAIRLR